MKKFIVILSTLLILNSCYEKEKNKEITMCFDIIKNPGIPNDFLINKCTGETWTLQFTEYPNTKKKDHSVGARSYQWTKINRTEQENVFTAM